MIFQIDISNHPALTTIKRRFIYKAHSEDSEACTIDVYGKIFHYVLVEGVETAINELGKNGFVDSNFEASNAYMVDSNSNRIDPDSGNGSGTPEYDYWINTYIDLIKVQGVRVLIQEMFLQQVTDLDSKGYFNK